MFPFQSYITGNKFFSGIIHSQIHMWYLTYHYTAMKQEILLDKEAPCWAE